VTELMKNIMAKSPNALN